MKKKSFILLIVLCHTAFGLAIKAQNENKTDTANTRVYQLGEIKITGLKDSPSVNAEEIEKFNRVDLPQALNLLPGITLANFGARNEATFFLKGFDLRQVPIYLDGIPVYVPYDGYVDPARFTTFNLSEIDVSSGFSSVLYGPNTLGGAINLVSAKPKSKFELKGSTGMMSGNGLKSSLNIGSKLGKFYIQTGLSKMKISNYPLSKNYTQVKNEDGNDRDNAFRDDSKVSFKVGYTPNKTDEYSINYIYQHGTKGVPVYAGSDNTIKPRYWQYPNWDKESVYFISNTTFLKKNYVKTRIYYDRFMNSLYSYDDATYTTITKPYAFRSYYNDPSEGASVEIGSHALNKNTPKLAFHYKHDTHVEHNFGEVDRHFQDNTITVALEDNYELCKKLSIIPGVSYNKRMSVKAENYNSTTKTITDFPSNSSDAWNAQVGMLYKISDKQNLLASVSHKTRFATLKDRYSYRLGTAIPNPDLKPEENMAYELTYTATFFDKIKIQPDFFYNKINDVIQSVNNVQPSLSQMQNTGIAEFIGGDLMMSYQIIKKILMGMNYSYIKRNNISNPSLKFSDVPMHKVFGYLQYIPIKRVELIVSGEYDSKRYSTSYGNIAADYGVVNARASFLAWKYFSMECGINNIFDKNYCISEGYPEEGRNYFASLIYKFNYLPNK